MSSPAAAAQQVDRSHLEVPVAREEVGAVAPPTRRRDRRRIGESAWIYAARVVVLIVAVIIWQLVYRYELVQRTVLPSPSQVWDALVVIYEDGILIPNLRSTMEATVVALLISSVVGVTIGIALALMPRVEKVFSVYIDALNSAPRIALAPAFVVLFGIGQTSKIILAITVAVFVVLASARAGVHAADDDCLRSFAAMGASKKQTFMKVLLPAAIPSIASGIRLGLIWSLLGVVAMEMISSTEGAGQVITQYSAIFRMDIVYAMMLVLVVVASVLNSVTRFIEKRLLRWQPPEIR